MNFKEPVQQLFSLCLHNTFLFSIVVELSKEKAIKNLRDGINHLEVQNAELYETADSKLAKLDEFLSKLRQMHQDLQTIKDNR